MFLLNSKLSYIDDVNFDLPLSGEQKVVRAGNFIVLDVCEDCGTAANLSEEDLKIWRQPAPWIESDDKDIAKLAAKVADSNLTDTEKMTQLGRFARHRIKDVDFMGHYSASDTMKRRKGDCGEDAVLLAALGRAAAPPRNAGLCRE